MMAVAVAYAAESASIRATATVITPLGLVESPPDTLVCPADDIALSEIPTQRLSLHCPANAGLICIIDDSPFFRLAPDDSSSFVMDSLITPTAFSDSSDTCLITIIYTEN